MGGDIAVMVVVISAWVAVLALCLIGVGMMVLGALLFRLFVVRKAAPTLPTADGVYDRYVNQVPVYVWIEKTFVSLEERERRETERRRRRLWLLGRGALTSGQRRAAQVTVNLVEMARQRVEEQRPRRCLSLPSTVVMDTTADVDGRLHDSHLRSVETPTNDEQSTRPISGHYF